MRIKKALSIFLAVALLISSSLFSSIVFGAQDSSIELQLDKTKAKVGEVITATISINNISNFAGYQVNLKYDPEALQPINKAGKPYTDFTNPESGTLLNNSDFGALPQASNNTTAGILNFGKVYTNLEEYRASDNAETNGSVAVLSFEVISEKPTSIVFEDTSRLPNAITGTSIFDWNGNRVTSGYTVVQAGTINSDDQNPITESNISLVYDRVSAKVGETVKVSLNVNNIYQLGGYQVNLKYDPEVLQPVTASGKLYNNNTSFTGGNMFINEDYSPFYQALHSVEKGILNFSASYLNLTEYKKSNKDETTGTLGVVEFKVLDSKATTVSFEESNNMPNAVSGTLLIDWNANRISAYKVNQAGILNAEGPQIMNGTVSMEIDKTNAQVGDIISAMINIDNIADFAGYQFNLSYDPSVLKPVTEDGEDYTSNTIPLAGDLLGNSDYNPFAIAAHNLSAGILSFGKSYTDLKTYKESGSADTKGTLAVVSFKVLKAKSTSILFESSTSMPNGISGTLMFDWNGDKILSGYTVTQPPVIKVKDQNVEEKSSISLEVDKNEVAVGDIITATLKADGMDNLAGFQVNIKYDQTVLKPIVSSTGEPYESNTNPEVGYLINNPSFGVVPISGHDLKSGVLNFARYYTNLDDYKAGEDEGSGVLAHISFKVIKKALTQIRLENTGTMPNAISGTMLFDCSGNRITSGYEVIQPQIINEGYNCESFISIDLDKTTASKGDIVNAKINVCNIDNLAGYQLNLKYDPNVLQPVDSEGIAYTDNTVPEAGKLISNKDFGIITVASHELDKGILNFSKFYTNLEEYKESEKIGSIGDVAVLSFKVLNNDYTSIKFLNTSKMPNGISGTLLFNCDGDRISGYSVHDSHNINGGSTSNCVPTSPPPTIVTSTPTPEPTSVVTPEITGDSYITIDLDKTSAKVNDTITATVMVNNIDNLAAYQVNLKYNPNMLQPITSKKVPYTNSSLPSSGTLLSNSDYGFMSAASNNVTKGILNFGRTYTNLEEYRASDAPENSGSIAVITFKVLEEGTTSLFFEDTVSMPSGICGTILLDWDGNRISSEYKVLQPEEIYIESADTIPTPEVTPTTDPVVTPTTDPVVTPTPTPIATPTPDPVATPTPIVTPTTDPVTTPTPIVTTTSPVATPTSLASSSYITIDFDKTEVKVGETIKATVRINEISKLSGYQVNLKYDPEVLQPIKPSGAFYTNSTIPSSGNIIANDEFCPINAVSHNLNEGILNFCKLYMNLEEYRSSEALEETGTIAVIEFKLLKAGETTITFENSSSMPSGINGTILFDSNGDRITSGYLVVQPEKIK